MQRGFSAKNDRYNNLTNKACFSNNDQFYTQTESNWNNKRKRKLTAMSHYKNNEKVGFPNVYTSGCPHNTANLYLNKQNYSFKKKATINQNDYFDKEQLLKNMIKLQTSLNVLNQKYHKQKMENDKQAKEIEKQNKLLNYINNQNFKNYDKKSGIEFNEGIDESKADGNINKKEREKLIKNLTRSNDSEYESRKFVELNEEKYNLNSAININKKISYNSLRELYNDLYIECKDKDKLLIEREKDKAILNEKNKKLRIANETLISNLKRQMKKIEEENDKKEQIIKDLKKNIKCSRYTELLKENEILNKELDKLKNKLYDALKLINDYKKQEEEIKKLYDVIKKKDFKIKALELELMTLSNNSDETTKKLQDEIIVKDKLLKKQERDMKRSAFEKYALMQGQKIDDINNKFTAEEKKIISKSLVMNFNEISNKYPELYQFYIEMKHKDITSSKSFSNEVLKNISDVINVNEAKTIYIDLVINYFNIDKTDEKSRDIIFNLSDKEFVSNRSIHEIKTRQLKIFDSLFSKSTQIQSINKLKKYISVNNLEELVKRTLMELDRDKLGYITFEEMKNVINEIGLNDYLEEILLLTKSEIFNRVDYHNLIYLFNSNENQIDINRYIQPNQQNIYNNMNNNENANDNNNMGGIHDINNDDNNNQTSNELDNKLKILAQTIKKEGSSANNYISSLKETVSVNDQNIDGIKIEKLTEFLNQKNINLNQNDINLLKEICSINGNNDFIDYEKFVQKLIKIIQDVSEHDENFLNNIQNIDINL